METRKKQDLQADESKCRIQILQVARPRNKKHPDINRGRWF